MTMGANQVSANDQLAALKQENAALKTRLASLEKQENAFEALLALISHEVKTPIGALIAMGKLLKNTDLSETQTHYINTLLFAAETLSATTRDMSYFAALKAGQISFEPKPVHVGSFLSSIALSIAPQAEARGLRFRAEMTRDIPTCLEMDQNRISQIILNLVNNALRFTTEGYIELNATAKPIDDETVNLIIAIKDSGIGISDEDQEKLFTPFFQASPSENSKDDGNGLGLWICRQIANGLKGELICDASPGAGSTFTLSFPARITQQSSAQPDEVQQPAPIDQGELNPAALTGAPGNTTIEGSTATTGEEVERPCLNGRVLLVDDNQVNQMLIRVYLEKFGLECNIASSGEQALAAVNTKKYDLILMDIMMPGLDGLSTTKAIRGAWQGRSEAPIIALSACDNQAREEEYKNAGIVSYLDKPLNAETLYETLAQYLPLAILTAEPDQAAMLSA